MQLRPAALVLGGLVTAASWLGMMVVHELGHVIHAWVSGGRISAVVLSPIAFSRTDLSSNPSPMFVAWGGAVWGCLIPLALWGACRRWRLAFLPRFFLGLCLLANGAYLAAGAAVPVGDAEEMLRLGCSKGTLVAVGAPLVIAGLACWNGLGRAFGFGTLDAPSGAMRVAAIATAGLAIAMTAWTVLV